LLRITDHYIMFPENNRISSNRLECVSLNLTEHCSIHAPMYTYIVILYSCIVIILVK